MKLKYKVTKLFLIFILTIVSPSVVGKTNDMQQIKNVILAYNKAMNTSSVDGVLALYTEDGVFMPSRLPTAMGRDQIRAAAYAHEFNVIDLEVSIVFDEIVQHKDIAFVRTRSKGHLTLLAKNQKISTEKYRAFFVLQKIKGEWKIARFMFNFSGEYKVV